MNKDMEIKKHEVLLENPQYTAVTCMEWGQRAEATGNSIKEKTEAVYRGRIIKVLYISLSKVFKFYPVGKWFLALLELQKLSRVKSKLETSPHLNAQISKILHIVQHTHKIP